MLCRNCLYFLTEVQAKRKEEDQAAEAKEAFTSLDTNGDEL